MYLDHKITFNDKHHKSENCIYFGKMNVVHAISLNIEPSGSHSLSASRTEFQLIAPLVSTSALCPADLPCVQPIAPLIFTSTFCPTCPTCLLCVQHASGVLALPQRVWLELMGLLTPNVLVPVSYQEASPSRLPLNQRYCPAMHTLS